MNARPSNKNMGNFDDSEEHEAYDGSATPHTSDKIRRRTLMSSSPFSLIATAIMNRCNDITHFLPSDITCDHDAGRSSSTASLTRAAAPAPAPATTTRSLRSIPKDVLANEVLGFLTDKAVKTFLESLGGERLAVASSSSSSSSLYYHLDKQFCTKHGSRLEDPNKFHNNNNNNNEPTTKILSHNTTSTLSLPSSCPECYAEQQNSKRCNGCKVFYPRFNTTGGNTNTYTNANNNSSPRNGGGGGPGLWCQQCDRMAFCNACLSNDVDGCGSTTVATTSSLAFGAFGRKRLLRSNNNNDGGDNGDDANDNGDRRHYCRDSSNGRGARRRITCHNCCCPNVFTNTMCGEFVCDDCGDEQQHKNSSSSSSRSKARTIANEDDEEEEEKNNETIGSEVETCDDCGKATCLDPNCLVCADFRLINISCNFVAEDAYKFNFDFLGLRGGRSSSSSSSSSHRNYMYSSADSSTKLRRSLSDCVVWVAFLFALSKMWWFQQEQQ